MRKALPVILTSILFWSCIPYILGQDARLLFGNIMDDATGEALVGATIWIPVLGTGATTDAYGHFQLKTDSDSPQQLIVSYIGYRTDTLEAVPGQELTIRLASGLQLDEVIISNQGARQSANFSRTRMSYIDLEMQEINDLPALMSENDVLKAVQLLPGIQSAEGASTGYYVRGGSSDQNLILLNDAVVYNPFHAAGFVSIFSGDIVDDVSIHKSAFPSKYGGRLSSHLQVDTKDASFTKPSGSFGIGMVTARLAVETPIIKNKLSLLVSGRGLYSYTLFRAFAAPSLKEDLPNYYFYDAYAQLNYKASPRDRIKLYYYKGKDLVSFQDRSTPDSTRFHIPWSNTAAGLNWKHLFSDRLSSAFSAYYTAYDFSFEAGFSYGSQGLMTSIDEWGSTFELTQEAGGHLMNFGIQAVTQRIRPEVIKEEYNSTTNNTTRLADVRNQYNPVTMTAFFNDDWSVTERFGINYGVRLPFFVGNGAFYYSIDPKIVLRYQLTGTSSLKASYSYGSQFVHMLVSSTATTPLDLWIASSPDVRPQRGHSAVAGYYQNFMDNKLEFSVEGYYKHLQNQIEYSEGVAVFSPEAIESKLLFGKGWNAGAEFFLRKNGEKWSGFVGYTLSWARRQFDELNQGKPFDYKYDRRHDMTASVNYQITDRWSVSTLFVIGSGQALTVPQSVIYTPRTQGAGTFVYDYGERNSFRLKPYHRMDLSVKYSGMQKRVRSHVKFDIYNLYNRKNTFFVILDAGGSRSAGNKEIYLREYSLIPITPSISYQMDF